MPLLLLSVFSVLKHVVTKVLILWTLQRPVGAMPWCGWRRSAVSCDWSREFLRFMISNRICILYTNYLSSLLENTMIIPTFLPSIVSCNICSTFLTPASPLCCGCTGRACWAGSRPRLVGVRPETILCPVRAELSKQSTPGLTAASEQTTERERDNAWE